MPWCLNLMSASHSEQMMSIACRFLYEKKTFWFFMCTGYVPLLSPGNSLVFGQCPSESSAEAADKPPLFLPLEIISIFFFLYPQLSVAGWFPRDIFFDLLTKGQQLKMQLVTWVLLKKEYSSDGLCCIEENMTSERSDLSLLVRKVMISVFSQLMCCIVLMKTQ